MKKRITTLAVLASLSAANATNYNIPAGDLGFTLNQIASQSGIALAFSPSLTQGKTSPAIQADYSPTQALQVALANSGLKLQKNNDGSYQVILQNVETEYPTNDVSEKADKNNANLDEVVVVDSLAPKSIAETTASVYYIDQEAVARGARNGKSVAQIIAAQAPSLNIASGGRTNFAQNMRGRSAKVMIDGVSLNSSRQVSREFDSISPFNIDHIEVLSGATAVYGGDATGGIINIVTKKGAEGFHGSTTVGVTSGFQDGDDMDYTFGQSFSGGNEYIQGRFGLNVTQTNAFFDGNGEQLIPDVIQGSLQHNRTVDVLAGVSIQPTEQQNLDFTAQYYDSEQDNPYTFNYGVMYAGLLKDPTLIKPVEGFKTDRQAKTKRHQFNLNYSHDKLFAGQDAILQLSHRREEMSFIPFPKVSYRTLSASQQTTSVSTLRAALVKEMDPVTLTYGIKASRESFDSNQMLFNPTTAAMTGGVVNKKQAIIGRYPEVRIDNLSAFAEVDYQLNNSVTLNGGYRFEYLQNTVGDFIGVDQQAAIALGKGRSADAIKGGKNNYRVHLFNLGARWDVSDSQQVWAKFAQGFELPDPAKYYGRGEYTLDGNHWKLKNAIDANENALEGIKTNSFELGWRLDQGALSLQTSAYYSLSDKQVTLGDSKNLSIDVIDYKRRAYGLEGEASYEFNDNWTVGGNFHVGRSEDKKPNGDWQRASVIYASTPKVGTFIDYHNDDWAARLSANSSFDLDGGDGSHIDGYTLVDLSTSYQLGGGDYGTLSLGINNLFDKQYTTIWGQQSQMIYGRFVPKKVFDYKGRGRTFNVNYRFDF